MKDRTRRDQLSVRDSGFTLIELVVAMFVIAIVLVTLVVVQASALVTIQDANRRQQATAFANEAMEQMRALPWTVLNQGLAGNFVAASGGDANVSGGNVTVGGITRALVVAPTTGAGSQDLTKPWPPLFDGLGSNKVTRTDPAKPNFKYEIRSYVTAPAVGSDPLVRGLVVVATWPDSKGVTRSVALRSNAYASGEGCGNLAVQPYLGSCQARFRASADSGSLRSSVVGVDQAGLPALVPGSTTDDAYVSGPTAIASLESQQVTMTSASMTFGSTASRQPLPAPGAITTVGGASIEVRASDDGATPNAPPAHNPSGTLLNGVSSSQTITGAFTGSGVFMRGDDSRTADALATTTSTCRSGTVPAGQPCAHVKINGSTAGTGSLELDLTQASGGNLSVFERTASASNANEAIVGRFITAPSGGIGCTTVAGAGCTAAQGSQFHEAIFVGMASPAYPWTSPGVSGDYLVRISNYSDSVTVQRGTSAAQLVAASTVTRTAQISYLTPTGYVPLNVTAATDQALTPFASATAPLPTFSVGALTVEASFQIIVVKPTEIVEAPDATCKADACAISATAGSISVTVTYTITDSSSVPGTWTLASTTVIAGSTATASYQKAPGA